MTGNEKELTAKKQFVHGIKTTIVVPSVYNARSGIFRSSYRNTHKSIQICCRLSTNGHEVGEVETLEFSRGDMPSRCKLKVYDT